MNNKRLIHYLLPVLLLATWTHADGQISPKKETRREDPYEYTVRLIESFNWAMSAESRKNPNKWDMGTLEGVAQVMVEIKLADVDYSYAVAMIEDFTLSKNETIQLSARGAHTAYTSLIEVDNSFIAELVKLYGPDLKASPRSFDPGALMDRMTDLQARRNQAWKLLPLVAAAGASHALVKTPERPEERLSRLTVTNVQRRDLLQRLEGTFGNAVKGGMKAGQDSLTAAGAALYEFLARPQWKAADEN